MRQMLLSLTATEALTFGACSLSTEQKRSGQADTGTASNASDAPKSGESQTIDLPKPSDVSLVKVSTTQSSAEAAQFARKIIRNAELVIESQNPEESFRKVASLAESNGGFVVTSEATQEQGAGEPGRMTVVVVVRVPASQFDPMIEEIRKVGVRVLQDKRTGQDVTEEYIDLEARLQAKRGLEAQFLQIMKQAHKVSDALEVQRQMAEVRGEIEQVEGRKRFVENQSSLSTIKLTLKPTVQIMAATTGGFISEIREAASDGVAAATAIVLVLLRIIIVLLPISLIALPIGLAARYWVRRSRRMKVI
jgi:hypothetical protein